MALALTSAETLAWPYRRELAADLDADGTPETVVLACDVTFHTDGEPLWEDGHRWAAIVLDGDAATLVYSAFVPHGFVEGAVLAEGSDGRREVLILERTRQQLRSLAIAYEAPNRARTASGATDPIDSWLPGSATLPGPAALPP